MKHFSDRETKIIKILGRKGMTLEEISTELFIGGKEHTPFDSVISVSNSVRRIIKKCSYHSLPWTFEKTRANNKLVIKRATKERK